MCNLGFPCGSAGKESITMWDPWVGKIPWRREWLPTPLSWPREFHGLYSLQGRKKLDITQRLSLSFSSLQSEKTMCLNVSFKTHHAYIANQSQGHMLGKLSLFSPRNTIFGNTKYKKNKDCFFFFNCLQFLFYFRPLGETA